MRGNGSPETEKRITAPQLIHLLCSSFVHGFFEFVRHDMPKDEALTYIEQLQTFFVCGWDHLFRP